MPAVTQLTPNFLGGVSRQNDDKKLNGQVTECINGYPDPTYGLLKRPGMRFTNVLKKADGTKFTKSELEDATWFFIERDKDGSYIGAIKGTNVYVWTAEDGTWCTVTNTGTSYLTGINKTGYHFRTVQDTTVITNKSKVTAMQTAGSFISDTVATVVLTTLTADFDYSVTLQGIAFTVTPQTTSTYDDMLVFDASNINTNHHLVDAVREGILAQQAASNPDFAGVWYLEGYTNSLVIKRSTGTNAVKTDYSAVTGTPTTFTVDAKGGFSNTALYVFQDQAENITKLPTESFHNHNVEILNSAAEEDNYYVKFVAFDGIKGRGYWTETIARDASPGLNASTMPHQLKRTGATSFEFKPLEWKPRATGDDVTSPIPSFIGYPITCTFYYGNRFGVLSEDNIFLGVANDSFNFFVKSALTQVASDPVDLNVSSVRPVTLFEVLPSPQGLMVFSERQQFQVFTTDGSVITPTSAIVRSISNYEMDPNISPVDVGTTAAFVSSVTGYSKLFTLQLRDVEQNPTVVDISKVVLEWIPESVSGLTVSPQNSVIMLVDRDTKYLYLFRYYNNGERDLFQAWTKWELPGNIQDAKIINDSVVIISQHEDEYTIGSITLDEIPSGDVVATESDTIGNPCLDMFTKPSPPGQVLSFDNLVGGSGYTSGLNVPVLPALGVEGTGLTVDIIAFGGSVLGVFINKPGQNYSPGDRVVINQPGYTSPAYFDIDEVVQSVAYDSANDVTKIYVPFKTFQQRPGVMLLAKPEADLGDEAALLESDAGYWAEALERTDYGSNTNYFEVKGNFLPYADGIIVGYPYDFDVTLPKFYYRREQNTTDFTATLTISRVKFSVGRTGAVRFKVKATGSNEWADVQHTAEADYYSSDSNPVQPEHRFTVPIHQRNTNFELKVTSNFPYPMSLVSMTWEGNYSPRFYRRT